MTRRIAVETTPISEPFPIRFNCGEKGCAVARLEAWRDAMKQKYGGPIYDAVSGWQTNCVAYDPKNRVASRNRTRPAGSRCDVSLAVEFATTARKP